MASELLLILLEDFGSVVMKDLDLASLFENERLLALDGPLQLLPLELNQTSSSVRLKVPGALTYLATTSALVRPSQAPLTAAP